MECEFGGPIRKQKSDFFLALERRDIHEFNVVNAVVLDNEGDETPFSENVSAPQQLWIGSVRTDWQLTPRNMLAATYSANVNDSDNVGSGGLVLPEAGYNSTASEQDLRLTDVFTLSPSLLHETHIGVTWKDTQGRTTLDCDQRAGGRGLYRGRRDHWPSAESRARSGSG